MDTTLCAHTCALRFTHGTAPHMRAPTHARSFGIEHVAHGSLSFQPIDSWAGLLRDCCLALLGT